MRYYQDFKSLREAEPDVAEELLEECNGGDEWQHDGLYVFDSYDDLGEYEIYDGALSEVMQSATNFFDFRTYVNTGWLGRDLTMMGNDYVLLSGGTIVYSVYGW